MGDYYGMFTAAGNRMIANRVATVQRNVDKAKDKEGVIKAIQKGVRGYKNMHSVKHGEYSDTAVREMFLDKMELIYVEATGDSRKMAMHVVSYEWNK